MPETGRGRRAFLGAVAATGVGAAQLGAAQAEGTNVCTWSGDTEPNVDGSAIDLRFRSAAEAEQSDGETLETHSTTVEEPLASSGSLDVSVPEMDVSLAVFSMDSGVEGPTALVVGGVHGDEEAGYLAAEQMLEWEPEAGRLVVLPRANPVAIAHESRSTDYGNLNRNFLAELGPVTPLAEAVWGIVEQTDPDAVLALHESRGIYDSSSAVGQAVFHSPSEMATDAARMGIDRANQTIRRRSLMFDLGPISPPSTAPSGLLTEKTTYSAGLPSFIVETYEGVSLDARIKWQKRTTRGILDYFDLYH